MSTEHRLGVIIAVAVLAAGGSPGGVRAQEADETEEGRLGHFTIELGTWIAQGSGHDLFPAALVDPDIPTATTLLSPSHGTENGTFLILAYELPRDRGALRVRYFKIEENDLALSGSKPGQFVFGETLAFPFAAGVNDDGLADDFASDSSVTLEDTRLDYSRSFVSTPRIRGDWFIGYRSVKYNRQMSVEYSALIPGFAPGSPAIVLPNSDTAAHSSRFKGRGLEGGMDLIFPLVSRIEIEAGFSLAVLRGETDVRYSSTTNGYELGSCRADFERPPGADPVNDPLCSSIPTGQSVLLRTGNYAELFSAPVPTGPAETVPQSSYVTGQPSFVNGVQLGALRTSSMLLETYLGLRGRIWKGLHAYGGFRMIYYDSVATEIRPLVADSLTTTINAQLYAQKNISVTYEGFYFGLGYTF